MASISFTIPDASVPRVVLALCASEGIDANAANAKLVVVRMVRERVAAYEASLIPVDVDGIIF